jgi:Iap family predicted aminopeptidase
MEHVATGDIFRFETSEEGISFGPGAHWNTYLAAARGNEAKLEAVGRAVGSLAGVGIHAGMVEFAADSFAYAAEPPFSAAEEKAFRDGAMAQYEVMIDLDRARGGQL